MVLLLLLLNILLPYVWSYHSVQLIHPTLPSHWGLCGRLLLSLCVLIQNLQVTQMLWPSSSMLFHSNNQFQYTNYNSLSQSPAFLRMMSNLQYSVTLQLWGPLLEGKHISLNLPACLNLIGSISLNLHNALLCTVSQLYPLGILLLRAHIKLVIFHKYTAILVDYWYSDALILISYCEECLVLKIY
jgi:hypothetical protein